MLCPYVSITDVTDNAQAAAMRDAFLNEGGAATGRRFAAGVMMSRKTLNGLPTKWARIFPETDRIPSIFQKDSERLNVLHYADYDGEDVLANLLSAAACCGPHLDAVQLDMVWPDPSDIAAFRSCHPYVPLILQGNPVAMKVAGNDPKAFADRISAYGRSVDGVLYDGSMGKGRPMDATALLPYLERHAARHPHVLMGVAGGLGPATLHLLEPVVQAFPDISIDAQGKLRRSGSALDPIDWDLAESYIRRAVRLFLPRSS